MQTLKTTDSRLLAHLYPAHLTIVGATMSVNLNPQFERNVYQLKRSLSFNRQVVISRLLCFLPFLHLIYLHPIVK